MKKGDTRKGWINPARLKIIIAILFIMGFAVTLDFTLPVSGGKNSTANNELKSQLDQLAHHLQMYHQIKGELPEFLIGGDKRGFEILKNSSHQNPIFDPLIEAEILDSYFEIKHQNLRDIRVFVSYKRMDRDNLYLFGRNGNLICNIEYLDSDLIRDLINDNPDSNPFSGCFKYNSNDNSNEFTISILQRFERQSEQNDLTGVFSVLKCTLDNDNWISEYSETRKKLQETT